MDAEVDILENTKKSGAGFNYTHLFWWCQLLVIRSFSVLHIYLIVDAKQMLQEAKPSGRVLFVLPYIVAWFSLFLLQVHDLIQVIPCKATASWKFTLKCIHGKAWSDCLPWNEMDELLRPGTPQLFLILKQPDD